MPDVISTGYTDYAFDDLDTSGNTTDYFQVENFRNHTVQFDVSNCSDNVVVRAEGSIDPSANQWFALDPSSNTTLSATGNQTLTADGTYKIQFSDMKLRFIRLNFVGSSGAFGSIVNIHYSGGL